MSTDTPAIEFDGHDKVNVDEQQREKRKWILIFGAGFAALLLLVWALWPAETRGIVEISEGRGLQEHVSLAESIDIAEQNGLPVSASPMGQGPYSVSYTEARALETQIAKIKIDVLVYPGDRINLDTGEYIPGEIARQMGR